MTLRYPEETTDQLLARLHVACQDWHAAQLQPGESAQHAAFAAQFHRLMPLPDRAQLHELLEAAFLASLLTEEGAPVSFTLGYIAPELGEDATWCVLRFPAARTLTPSALRRLSPALLPDSMCCGVFPNAQGILELWGLIFLPRAIGFGESSDLPGLTMSSYQPGTILVRYAEQDVMLDRGGRAAFLDDAKAQDQAGLQLFLAQVGSGQTYAQTLRAAAQLLRLAQVARHTGHGAIFLIVPSGSAPEALAEPQLGADAPSCGLLGAALQNPAFPTLPDLVARLAFIDGALVVDSGLRLLGAGAMIRAPRHAAPGAIHYLPVRPQPPPDARVPRSVDEFPGGARHRAAVEFCYWNPGAVALVVSQDGVMSLMSRPPQEEAVLVLQPFYLSGAAL